MRITTENHGPNSMKIYHLISLLTNFEVLLGTVNACLPVMKPIFTKLYSSEFSTWLSSVTSGTIVVFLRPSQMGSAWKSGSRSKRNSANKPPLPTEMAPWNTADNRGDTVADTDQSPPPRYVDNRPTNLQPTYNQNKDAPPKSPKPPVPPKSENYSPTKRRQPVAERAPNSSLGIYVERSWDVDREERGESPDDDRQELVKGHQQWR